MSDILEVWLEGIGHPKVRVGLLVREANRTVRFTVDDGYIELGPTRPVLGSVWHVPGDDDKTVVRLRDTRDKVGRMNFLPGWFSNLLPEGALRTMIEAQMPSGQADEFEIIRRLGHDLPGAIVVKDPSSANDLSTSEQGGREAPAPIEAPGSVLAASSSDTQDEETVAAQELPRLKFSLAGMQMKFSAMKQGERLTAPAAGLGHIILKLANDRFPDLPELEYASMLLAEAAGVQISRPSLISIDDIDDIPRRLLHGKYALAVERFDRLKGGRVHIEDMSQIFEAVGDQKYARANEESIINAVRRFSSLGQAQEQIKRVVVNMLLGNCDAHLKNTSLIYPNGTDAFLAPAYDIVAIHALTGEQEMALKLAGTKNPLIVTMERFDHIASYFGMEPSRMQRVVFGTLREAHSGWRKLHKELPLSKTHIARLDAWWKALPITGDLTSPFS